jgi:glycosyltransferase involved in cell wall biosynthesis
VAGTIEKRKNLTRVIRAFEIIHEKERDLQLVIAGGEGHGVEEINEQIDRSSHRVAIHRLGFVSDEMLVSLYRDAIALLYPSLYEGFGIPILEAMAAGCPVITSKIGAMAEVADNAALLVDPNDTDEMVAAMERVIYDTGLRESLIAAGLNRARERTWERCTEETLGVYREASLSR